MEQKFLTPQELFADEEYLFEENFDPEPFGQKNILFWHVPAFLEKNDKNLRLTEITASEENKENGEEGNTFRFSRLNKVTEYTNNVVFPKFDEVAENLWLNEPKREELIEKAEQLIVRSQYNLGYGQSGLYLDFNKFFEIFNNNTPFLVAERVIDNNLFLGNMATFYTILTNDKMPQEDCEKAKENYKNTLRLMGNPEVHFSLPLEKKIIYKYVQNGQQVFMKFFEDYTENDLFDGFGPQFLYDAKLFKNKEMNFIKDSGKDKSEEIKLEVELRNLEEQTKKLAQESKAILDKENVKVF